MQNRVTTTVGPEVAHLQQQVAAVLGRDDAAEQDDAAEVNELKERGFWFTSVNPFKHEKLEGWDTWPRHRQIVDRCISNAAFEAVMGLFISFQLVLAVTETDSLASGQVGRWLLDG